MSNIADDATYVKVQKAKADAINGGTFDAASVVAYGLGTNAPTAANSDLNDLRAGGMKYATYNASYHFPAGVTASSFVFTLPGSASTCAQILLDRGGYKIFVRYYISSAWQTGTGTDVDGWMQIFTAYTDGNGGQPPAPKPTTGTPTGGANGVGQRIKGSHTTFLTPSKKSLIETHQLSLPSESSLHGKYFPSALSRSA